MNYRWRACYRNSWIKGREELSDKCKWVIYYPRGEAPGYYASMGLGIGEQLGPYKTLAEAQAIADLL